MTFLTWAWWLAHPHVWVACFLAAAPYNVRVIDRWMEHPTHTFHNRKTGVASATPVLLGEYVALFDELGSRLITQTISNLCQLGVLAEGGTWTGELGLDV